MTPGLLMLLIANLQPVIMDLVKRAVKKATGGKKIPKNLIPVVNALMGMVIAVAVGNYVELQLAWTELTAIGGTSGLAATGIHQVATAHKFTKK